jgi:hypothetical protein
MGFLLSKIMNKYLKIALRTLLFVCVSTLTTWRSVGQNSLYTGQAPIGIPLYTVSDGKTQIPIGLNYNASGIKPNEHPGWVGQNWNLQAGGFVARKVNGLPDDMKADFKAPQIGGKTVTVLGMYSRTLSSSVPELVTANPQYSSVLIDSYDRYLQLQKFDTETDEYYFSLPNGVSGAFLLDATGKWIIKGNKNYKVTLLGLLKVPFTNWKNLYPQDIFSYLVDSNKGFDCIKDNVSNICTKIVPTYTQTFKGFVVTDDTGNEYTFGGDSTSIQYSIPLYQQYYAHWKADAWFLTKVKPVGGTEITLKYDELNDKFNGKDVGGKFQIAMTPTFQKNTSSSAYTTSVAFDIISDSTKTNIGDLIRPVYLRKIETIRDSVVFYKSRSVEMTYEKDLFRSSYKYWKQNVVFYQKVNLPIAFPPSTKPAPAWLPNIFNDVWETTDSLDKYLNNVGWAKLDRIKVFSKVAGENHAEIEYILKYNNSNKNYIYQTIGNKVQRTGGFNERIRLDTLAQIAGGKSLIYRLDYYKSDTMSLPRYLDKDLLIDHWGYFNKKKSSYTVASNRNSPTKYFKQRNSTKLIEVARLGTLKSITYPTGGKSVFEYEQNTYSKKYEYGVVSKKILQIANSPNYVLQNLPVGQQVLSYYRKLNDSLILYNDANKNFKTLATNNILPLKYTQGNAVLNRFEYGAFYRDYYVDSTKIDTVGGLRIKKITSFDLDGTFIGKKSYKYSESYRKPNSSITSGILDNRFGYVIQSTLGEEPQWYGGEYKLNGQNFDKTFYPGQGTKYNFNAIGHFGVSPVTYNEVTEENFDGSYSTYHFTNFYSKIGGKHLDEPYPSDTSIRYLQSTYSYFDLPYIEKSFERGRICLIETYRNDDKIVNRMKMDYKSINGGFINSIYLSSDFVNSRFDTEVNAFNFFANAIVSMAASVFTGGGYSVAVVTAATVAETAIPFLLPTSTPASYAYFDEKVNPQKIYTYNYEMSSDSTWTFDYTDPTKKFVTVNNYKYNPFGQLRELKRVQNDGLELLTNNKYISDYDFGSLISGADYSSCTNAASACQVGCINTYPNQDDAAICQAQCGDQEAVCRQNIVTNLISNPTSKNLYKMQLKNMVGYPVESIVKRKNINTTAYKVLGGTLNFYGEFNANGTLLYAPQSILKMKQTQTNATADTSKLDASGAFVYDQTRYTVKTFETTPSDGYGAYGNLTKYMGRDGVSNTMTHNAMNYPISKNIGITYGGNEFYSTMEYAPILGMIKTADQNNRKIRNRYDEFNRLRSVSKTLNESGTDNDYLLKLYNYHYFNDNSDITISDFVVGGCNGDSPASCTLRATIAPNSFVEMKVGSGLTTTITGSFDAGINTVTDAAKYTWINPAGTVSTTAAYTIPALTAANLPSVLGVYYYKVEKGGCQACLKFTISKKTTATDPDLLAEEDK